MLNRRQLLALSLALPLTMICVTASKAWKTSYAHVVTSDTPAVLQSAPPIEVVVRTINFNDHSGFSAEDLRTDTEAVLRQGGIRVLSEGQNISKQGKFNGAALVVDLNVLPQDIHLDKSVQHAFVYSLSLEYMEAVALRRPPYSTVRCATTWHTNILGYADISKANMIRESVKYQTNRFLNDYQDANSKK